MSNQNGYQGGGAEYGAPQYVQPSMRPVGSPAYDAGAERWGQAAAPSAATPPAASRSPVEDALALGVEAGVITLSRPYRAHGEDVQTIRLRRPTGRDVAQCGYPFRYVQSGGSAEAMEFKIVPDAVSKLIVALSSPPLPRSTVDSFDIKDWTLCSSVVNAHFLE
jgi:hypothetical protein